MHGSDGLETAKVEFTYFFPRVELLFRPLMTVNLLDFDAAGQLCQGIQIHVEDPAHYDHAAFRPWRLLALAFKALHRLQPDYPLWRDFPYEYEQDRLAIDLINGGELLRQWVDDPAATPAELDALASIDEAGWQEESAAFKLY